VQINAAKSSGVVDGQIVVFDDQPSAVAALRAGQVDAYAATAVGNRALAAAHQELEAVAHPKSPGAHLPIGAFSFNKENRDLVQAVNKQLRAYLGTADHRARMAKYGIGASEIDGVVAGK
jgi:polar amino acid transport system substrate-binding protein